MHPAVLHHRDLYRQTILKIQKSGTLTGDLKLPASRGRRSAGISILITAFWGSQAAVALANTNWLLVAIFAVCVVLLQKFKMNPIWVMVLAGVIKTVVSLIVSVF